MGFPTVIRQALRSGPESDFAPFHKVCYIGCGVTTGCGDIITHTLPLERIYDGFDLMLVGESIRAVAIH